MLGEKEISDYLDELNALLIKYKYEEINPKTGQIEVSFLGRMLASCITTLFCLVIYFSSAFIFYLISKTYK